MARERRTTAGPAARERADHAMSYGHFDDADREYVITRPDTPWPWINYLGSEDFFSLVSNTGGGYSFYKDARLRRITRYRYNDVPLDSNGRLFYVRDGDSIWNPGWRPARTLLDSYECRHGMGYTRICSRKDGVEAEVLFFVPVNADCEVQRVLLRNTSRRRKSLKLFAVTEFCLWNALDDMTNFQRNLSTGEVEVDAGNAEGVIYHVTEYRERRNHFAFYSVNAAPSGFDTDRSAFTGPYSGYERPDAVVRGKLSGSLASGWSPVAVFQLDVDLDPGEEKSFIFVLGYVEATAEKKWETPGRINREQATALRGRFATDGAVAAEMAALRARWEDLLGRFLVASGDPRLDRMVNTWNQYQCMVTCNMARSASFFESGIGRGIGFRDTSQDLLGCVHQVPERVRERLLDVASTQFPDGGAWHQYQPLTKRGNAEVGGGFNDDPLWLILGVAGYLKETGDWAFLQERVPFDNDPADSATLLDHLGRSFRHVLENLGPHGLPLIGHADWNDCLNLNCFSTDPNESFQTATSRDGRTAESVFIAGMFVLIGREYAEICRRSGRAEEATAVEDAVSRMRAAVLAHGWDGEWFLRAWDDEGHKVGSRECEDGQIYVESNAFCAMAEIGAEKGLPAVALDSVAARLATPHGLVLLDPPYRRYHVELGEVSSYPPGYKENGGVFCHNNPWIMIAECLAGRPEKAFDYYCRIAPAWRDGIQELHRMEPYVYSQMIAGRGSPRHGEAKNSWLTGAAAWNFIAVSQWILGVRPEYDGLRIEPCLPRSFARVEITRVFRGCTYRISVRNTGRARGRQVLMVRGSPHASPVVAPGAPGSELRVSVEV
jgi:cellobiose phosphorylase